MVDMRAEVALLSRRIRIDASQSEDDSFYMCRVLVTDEIDTNGDERFGSLIMDQVEVKNCGQRGTLNSAIKFEAAKEKQNSMITNSAIHSGETPGVIIQESNGIIMRGNVIADFARHGLWAYDSSGLQIDNNWVFHVINEVGAEPIVQHYQGWLGGFTLSENVSNTIVTRNVVAGTWHHGFHFIPQECGVANPSFIFRGNVAHSIMGTGAIALNVANDCTEVKDFTAYKTTQASIQLAGPSKINRGRNIVSIDTVFGPAVFPGKGTSELLDSYSIGELKANEDCPQGSFCDHCFSRTGMIPPQVSFLKGANKGDFIDR